MKKIRSQGFTLIELLVVIAIIGILSAVVLASLNTARSKGTDAAVQSDMKTVQTQAAIYQTDHNGSYNSSDADVITCTGSAASSTIFADPTVASAIAAADTANGTKNVVCAATKDGTAFAVAAQLVTSDNYFCVDSTGTGTTTSSAPATTGTITGLCQ